MISLLDLLVLFEDLLVGGDLFVLLLCLFLELLHEDCGVGMGYPAIICGEFPGYCLEVCYFLFVGLDFSLFAFTSSLILA